jgi:hypothetical protein
VTAAAPSCVLDTEILIPVGFLGLNARSGGHGLRVCSH